MYAENDGPGRWIFIQPTVMLDLGTDGKEMANLHDKFMVFGRGFH